MERVEKEKKLNEEVIEKIDIENIKTGKIKKKNMTYCVIDRKTNELVKKVSSQGLKDEYGITKVSQKFSSNQFEDLVLSDGNILIEDGSDEHIRKSFITKKYAYYASNKGYIIEVDKATRERNILKYSRIKNELYFKDDEDRLHRLASAVLKAFNNSLPKEYTVMYNDNNQLNCCLDNLTFIPKTKQIIF